MFTNEFGSTRINAEAPGRFGVFRALFAVRGLVSGKPRLHSGVQKYWEHLEQAYFMFTAEFGRFRTDAEDPRAKSESELEILESVFGLSTPTLRLSLLGRKSCRHVYFQITAEFGRFRTGAEAPKAKSDLELA